MEKKKKQHCVLFSAQMEPGNFKNSLFLLDVS